MIKFLAPVLLVFGCCSTRTYTIGECEIHIQELSIAIDAARNFNNGATFLELVEERTEWRVRKEKTEASYDTAMKRIQEYINAP